MKHTRCHWYFLFVTFRLFKNQPMIPVKDIQMANLDQGDRTSKNRFPGWFPAGGIWHHFCGRHRCTIWRLGAIWPPDRIPLSWLAIGWVYFSVPTPPFPFLLLIHCWSWMGTHDQSYAPIQGQQWIKSGKGEGRGGNGEVEPADRSVPANAWEAKT